MSASDKPDVLERLGSALNSSNLQAMDEKLGAVDLISAMAFSQTNASAAEHQELEAAAIDPRTELGSLLVRLKYARDGSVAERTMLKLEHWVTHQKAFRRWKIKPGQSRQLRAFVCAGLDEWFNPVCGECHGRQLVGLDRGEVVERRVRCARCAGRGTVHEKPHGGKRGQLFGARLAPMIDDKGTRWCVGCRSDECTRVTRSCPACGGGGWRTHRKVQQRKTDTCGRCKGTGLRIPSSMERASAIGVDVRVYERHWAKRFSWLAAGLDRLDLTEKRSLQSWLGSGISRA